MNEKAEHSMKIFISYGHPEVEICRRIMERLKKRGHEVWFDTEQIHHGEDWRRRIEAGIKESEGVISCLSKHSVRDPGVCLDELSIAVGVTGGNIFTVLLESEREVRPPASICHLQWVDMHDWQQRWGTPDFEPWFNARMEQIIERIESPESVRFAGEIEELKKRLTVDYSTGKQRDLLSRAFVGREWLADEVRAWLNDPNGAPLCVLYGDPGVGKSAFAARFGHYNQAVAASLFLEYDQPHYRDARSVIMTLAYLLACRILDFRLALLTALEGLDLSRLNESALFDRLIVGPARLCINGARDTMCVIIDGLDESSGAERNALAEVLSDSYVRRLPGWLRILVTSREVTEVMAPLEGAFQLTLHGAEERNRADIRAYFTEMLDEKFGSDPAWPAALDALVERSDGIFLYAQLVVDGMQKGRMGIGDTSQFPQGLSAAFHHWFKWYFPDYEEYKRKFRLPLGMILASPEPLPRDELMRTLDWGELEQADFIRRIQVLLLQDEDDFGQPTIRFSHQYLMEWLSADPATQPYAVSRRDSIAAMARAFYEYFEEDPEDLTFYEALHLTDYLRQAGKKARAREAETNHGLLWRIIEAGDHCETWGKLDHALACFRQGQAMAEVMCAERDEPEDRRDLGGCFHRAASILETQGKLNEALSLYEESIAIAEQLVRMRDITDDRRNLSIGYNNVANIRRVRGKLDEALELYKKSLAIHEQLVREYDTIDDRRSLGVSYANVAGILEAQGKTDEALALYEKALAIAERLVHERGTFYDRRDLSISYINVAGILEAQEKLNEALALYEKALAIREQLVRERGTPKDRWELSNSQEKIADILKEQGKLDEALAWFEKSLAIQEQLVREYDTSDNRGALGISYGKLADTLKAQGKTGEALALYEKALAVLERLVRERGTTYDRRNLSISYERIAGSLTAQEKLDEALAIYEKSLAIHERLVRELDMPEDRRGLGVCCIKVADIRKEQGKLNEARELYGKALAIFEQLVRGHGTINDRRDLGVSYSKVAGISEAQGKLGEALALYEKALAIHEQVMRECDTPYDHRNLGISYEGIARTLEACGKTDEALAFYEKNRAIRERLYRECSTLDNLWELGVSYSHLARIRNIQGKLDEALAWYEEFRAIAERLVRERDDFHDWDDLAVTLHFILQLPNVPTETRLPYARRGLEIAQTLLKRRPSDRYRTLTDFFQAEVDKG